MFCKHLDINIFPFKSRHWVEDVHDKYYNILKNPTLELSAEFQRFLFKKNFFVSTASLFYLKPYEVGEIHIDGPPSDFIKMNFVFGGRGSIMNWYSTDVEKDVYLPYGVYTSDEVKLIHSEELQGTNLVQVGMPHNIENGPEPRYCLSIFIKWISGGFPTMHEASSVDWSK